MREALRRLLDDFDAIESEHGEVYETDVREAIWLCLRNVLLIPRPGYQIPRAFEMVTDEGNAMVAAALDRFLNHPDAVALGRLQRRTFLSPTLMAAQHVGLNGLD
jgi:hypothetical protein